LNPAGDQKIERFGWIFAPGDKVMQIQNDYEKEVYNGDIGYIDEVDLDDGELVASFDGRAVTYALGELDTLVPAYAATIHKSRGSEYPAVVIPVRRSTTPCCNETCFIQVSPVAKSSSCSSVKRRRSPLLFGMFPAGADGQN
jgi:ATP-dependent exoDNAse (exonuclease V) alpha subunit